MSNTTKLDHTAAVTLLLDMDADINAKDNNGRTPLHNVSWTGHTDVVQLLLNKGADINAKDKQGRTPLQSTISYETRNILYKAHRFVSKKK